LAENLTMVLLMVTYPNLYPDEIMNNVETRNLIWIVVVGWLISVALQVKKRFYNNTCILTFLFAFYNCILLTGNIM
jgi:hypothetical protein